MGPGKKRNENLQQQNILQAVIVADSFDSRFQPVSEDIPLCLFPVVNQPLLAYTLKFLATSGIQHIFVYCSHQSALVKEYLVKSKWTTNSSQCKVTLIVSSDFASFGDVMRDIEQKAIFETDFILVAGNVISNMPLEKALSEHRERREKDKNRPLMTLLVKECPPTHRERSSDEDILISLDSTTNQILHYQKVSPKNSKLSCPVKNLLQTDCSRSDLRYDLADTCVAICSPQVPQLFTDNFDYQTREDFIRGILINEEFLGNQMHVHIVQGHFAARVSSFHMYDTISRAILSRWTFPHVPDNDLGFFVASFSEDRAKEKKDTEVPKLYSHLRHNVYLGRVKSLGKDSSVEDNSVVGHDTKIGNGCQIRNSVIGCDCVIEDDVIIEDSYLWSGVVVQSGCRIKRSLLCDQVSLHANCILEPGCILTSKVEVGPEIVLKENTVIQKETEDEAFMEGEGAMKKEIDESTLGTKGRGSMWSENPGEGSDDEMENLIGGIWGMSLLELEKNLSESEDSETSEESGSLSDESDMAEYKSDDEEDSVKMFYREVKDSVLRGVEEKVKCENLILEINSSKYAYNVTIFDVIRNVTKSALEIATALSQDSPYFSKLKEILLYLRPALVNYCKNGQAQSECIYEIETYCLKNKTALDCLMKILMTLYDSDVLTEEVVLRWHEKPRPNLVPADAHTTPENVRQSVTKFIDWLKEADEESSDEDS